MARSLKKDIYIHPKLLKKIQKAKEAGNPEKVTIKTWARSSLIIPDMVGMTFDVYNGKTFIAVKVEEDMIGHKLGEFAPTRKFVRHGGKLQRELEIGKK